MSLLCLCFFFSSRRRHTRCALVTGVQTCALPIYASGTEMIKASALDRKFSKAALEHKLGTFIAPGDDLELEDGTTEGQSHELPVDQAAQPTSAVAGGQHGAGDGSATERSEEGRVGKECVSKCRSRW